MVKMEKSAPKKQPMSNVDKFYIAVFSFMMLVNFTTPSWAGKYAIGNYPVYIIVWCCCNIITAVMISYYAFVIKGGADQDD